MPPEIRLLALDVDGVMTDGKLTYSSTGAEHKSFNVKDGLGISLAIRAGVQIAVITARESMMVRRRVEELGIQHLFESAKTKLPVLEKLAADLGIPMSHVGYMGDDLPDIPVLRAVGFSACPADAADVVKAAVVWVASRSGGQGAVREMLEYLMPEAFSLATFESAHPPTAQ